MQSDCTSLSLRVFVSSWRVFTCRLDEARDRPPDQALLRRARRAADARAVRCLALGRRRRVHGHRRSERLRQDDAAQHRRRPAAVRRGHRLDRRQADRGPGVDRAVVFQHASLLPWRTIAGNVRYGMELQKRFDRADDGRADRLFHQAGRAGRVRAALPVGAVRRHAAARQPGARAGGRSARCC